MKKLIFAVAVVATLSSCGGGIGKVTALKSEADTLAYAMGMNIGQFIKQIDSTANLAIVMAAAKEIVDNKEPKMTMEQMDAFMRDYLYVRVPAKNRKASEEYIASIEKSNANIKKTESGLLYEVIEPGDTGAMVASDADTVRVLYTGVDKSGVEFDSSTRKNPDGSVLRVDTLTNLAGGFVPGFSEGIKLIGKGGKIKLYIPSDLAYGEQPPYGAPIKPNEALVFDVELVDIKAIAPEAAE